MNNSNKRNNGIETNLPKYPKPNILLIDLPDEVFKALQSKEFNVQAGTFGSPYHIDPSNSISPIILNHNLQHTNEQEVIFIDLTLPDASNELVEVSLIENEEYYWAKCNNGIIDPRPISMDLFKENFDRIYEHGGLFVIFASPREISSLIRAQNRKGSPLTNNGFLFDNWNFLSFLGQYYFNIDEDNGTEIHITDNNNSIASFLRQNMEGIHYNSILRRRTIDESEWISILKNKFDQDIGVILSHGSSKGRILVLPRIPVTPENILKLLNDVLPTISPHLFPYLESSKWIKKDEYAFNSILKLKAEKDRIIHDTNEKVEELDHKISDKREEYNFIYRILTGTGDELVDDVERCLKFIGFEKVRNIDKELESGDNNHRKQEDLQICDKSSRLLVEVKGLTGYPSENNLSQVSKYVLRRIRDWNITDVKGVSIINHYRNNPPLERDDAFTEAQISDAEYSEVTILTTWDLFLLIKGMIEWKWDPKYIQKLFYEGGRMPRIPKHYEPIGKVVNYWDRVGVVGIQISQNKLCNGQRIGYVLPTGFLEENVSSLQVENKDVNEALPGQLAGVKTNYSKDKLKKGVLVCRMLN